MRLICLPIILASLALALSAQATLAARPLASLLVQRSDLRTGYSKPAGPGYTHMLRLPDGTPVGQQLLARHGYILSYAAHFTDYARRAHMRVISALITESLDKYRDASGAHWGYSRMVNARYPQSIALALPHIGAESSAYSAVLPEAPGNEIDIFFRSTRYVVRLALASSPVKASSALALARLVNGRIAAEG